MDGDQIRALFLEFFQNRAHIVVPSASLIPAGDPTLLFTSAGMVPFKPYFMGETTPPAKRLTSVQKSFRTSDVEEVGDHKHLTFFEMLGNFSVGDYFKPEAVDWSWEFVTQHFKLEPERLFVTIYLDDEEAFKLWNEGVGVPSERIFRYGDEDNWWGPAGIEGPCGPCSEIHYDGGIERGCGQPDCHPNHECERFVELWNLVFMQYYQSPDGSRTPLPAPSIDTGMGLERAAAILQQKTSVYETDLLRPILDRVVELSGQSYAQDSETDYALRVVAEHARAVAFLINDGVVPGNGGRGYVLRRVIRRAIRYGRRLGLDQAFFAKVADAAVDRFHAAYPELSANRSFIQRVVSLEEERFAQTYERGMGILEGLLEAYKGVGVLSGSDAFTLSDTYGFPPELTSEIASENGFSVDMEGFEREMEAQRERARSAHGFVGGMEKLTAYEDLGIDAVWFVGYEELSQSSVVVALLEEDSPVGHASEGKKVEVVLQESPFYPEGGGQVGDSGVITGPSGTVRVEHTHAPVAGLIVHEGVVEWGSVSLGDQVEAVVEERSRADAARNHSGTHLLHAALRQTLGPHVRQAGSYVAPDRLRFDYSHVGPLSKEEQLNIQSLVNDKIMGNLQVSVRESSLTQAVQDGALAFFGDRYGDVVRVVEMSSGGDPFSVEVCGGTHVHHTGEVGPLFVIGDSGIGGGMRRIEAVTGRVAHDLFVERSALIDSLAQKFQTPSADLETRLESFLQEWDNLRKRLESLERMNLKAEAEEALPKVQDVDGVKVLAVRTSAASSDAIREMGDWLRDKLSSGVVVLGSVSNGRPTLMAMVTKDLVEAGLHAGNIVKEAAQVMGGSGGGRPDMAQAGGRDPDKLDDALRATPELVRKGLGK